MTRWIYKVVALSSLNPDADYHEARQLAEAGRGGWELVAVLKVANGARMYFKQQQLDRLEV